MNELGIGVIGTGFMGKMHANIFRRLPNCKLVGVTDKNLNAASDVAKKLGIKVFNNYDEMLNSEEIDAVSICVSDAEHLAPAVAAAKAKKHILLEKPIATVEDEAELIVKEASKNNVKLAVGHLLRFDSRYRMLKNTIDSGELGQLTSIYTRRNSPISDGPARYGRHGNLTLHVAVHDIDLVLWMMNKKPIRVYAESVSIANKSLGIEDAIFASVKFEDGSIGCLQYNWALPKNFPTHIDAKMHVIGTKGYGSVDCADQGVWICSDSEGLVFPDLTHWPEFDGQITGNLREELSGFVNSIVYGEDFGITPSEAVDSVKLALAIIKSIQNETVITL